MDLLNAVITAQQAETEELRQTCKLLFKKLQALEDGNPQGRSRIQRP